MSNPLRVAIVGGTGYAGLELLRLFAGRSDISVVAVGSRQEAGRPVVEVFPSLRGAYDLAFSVPDPDELGRAADVVFFATPHGAAQAAAPTILEAGARVVDLSADFRLRDVPTWEHWYGQPHQAPSWVTEAVYGLPEWNREALASARLVACPGCYPTAVELALMPLLQAELIAREGIIADCKSGASGAGRAAKIGTLLCEAGENFGPYAPGGHRHQPEIDQCLADIAGAPVECLFQPHLVPMIRGIEASIYVRPSGPAGQIRAALEQAYAAEPFVDVLPAGSLPATRNVRGTNRVQLAVDERGSTTVVFAVIDNLLKGAAGQAVQCMNLQLGWPESLGLDGIAHLP